MKTKRPRPTVVEKIKADQAEPRIDSNDIRYMVAIARRALPSCSGAELAIAGPAIDRLEAALRALPQPTDGK